MRIQFLHLIAFGHFTNKSIDLSRGKEGLHIIYGPNESGKSSSLRALRQVLYGIPSKSTDNFKHAHPDMRIGIELKHSDGSTLKVVRRKGNTKTLRRLDAENELVDPALLQHYLGNINQTTFENMFGIDHPALVSGGEAILKGNGELGQLLFSAGAGIADLRSVLNGLEKEYQDLYTRTGSVRVINRQLSEYAEAKKVLRDSELPNSEWERHDQALRQAQKRKEQLDQTLIEHQHKVSTLRRYRDAIPLIAERSLYHLQLSKLSDAPLLPDNFEDNARNLLEQILMLRNEEAQDENKITELNAELATLQIPEGIIERATSIESLQQKLGSHQKAALDRLSLEQNLIEEQERARICLHDLGRSDNFEAASNLRISVQEKTRLRKLALERRALWQAYSDAQALRQRTEQRLRQCSDELVKLDKLPVCEKLLVCYKRIQQDPQIEERSIAERNKLERTFRQMVLDLRKLQFKNLSENITLEDATELHSRLHATALPDTHTIESMDKEFNQLGKEIEAIKSRSIELTNELREIQYRLQEHDLKIAAPTEDDLREMRRIRDAGWNLVLKLWKDRNESSGELDQLSAQLQDYLTATSASELGAAFEWAQGKSDTVADRLRHEADHVAQKIQLTAQLQRVQANLADATVKLSDRETRQTSLKERWNDLWSDLIDRQVNTSSAKIWLTHFETLRNNLTTLLENLESAKFNTTLVSRSKSELVDALNEAGWYTSSSPWARRLPAGTVDLAKEKDQLLLNLLEQAQQCLDHYRSLKQSQTDLEREIAKLQIDLSNNSTTEQTRKTEIDSWAASWQPAVEGLGLSPTTSPEELTAFLDRLEQFFTHYDQVQNLKRRIAGIDRDADQFAEDVRQAVNNLSSLTESSSNPANSKIASLPPEQAAIELFVLLKKAKEIAQRHQLIKQRRDELHSDTESRKTSLQTLSDKLNQMLAEACVNSEANLLDAAKNSQQRRRLSELVDNYDRQLLRLAEGTPLDDFISNCNSHTVDDLNTQIKQIEDQQRLQETERDELQITIGSEKQILQAMDGSANAAEAASRLQQVLAELGQDVEQYSRLRIASVILKKAIERYREKNQSPILRTASDIFAKLSNGNFSGLQEDFNEKGEPVLFGVRSGLSSLTPIEGMSEGTCDQVYLALRLAGLTLYLEKEEPLPFIVDDILVNFDDQRSLSTLRVLSELSRKVQIIMFTHHTHIIDLAKEHLDPDRIFVHGLDDSSASLVVPQQTVIPGVTN